MSSPEDILNQHTITNVYSDMPVELERRPSLVAEVDEAIQWMTCESGSDGLYRAGWDTQGEGDEYIDDELAQLLGTSLPLVSPCMFSM